ncbi:TonB-dependent receptor plug domain-containing protein [Nitrospira sp. BLG_1]|uniref:TonB-dependent receptor plug domain-containing protein n=1 Tax=Nitrospira sp. BLG_1 TaxID=3395883 RepID=UPI0039BC2644
MKIDLITSAMPIARSGFILWRLRSLYGMVLAATLFTVWEWPSYEAAATEAPPPAQVDSVLDLPLELPAPATPGTGEFITDSTSNEKTLFDDIPSVYGAAKYDQKTHQAPAAITIITAEQIRKYGYRNFGQILDSIPGLFTNTDRNYGYLGIRGLNRPGDYNTRVLILVDNHRLQDSVYDQAGVGTELPIDVDLIDRVEVIRGPSSSLYGTNAFLGVINIITKRGRDIKGVELSGEASSFNTYRGRLSYGNKFANGVEMLLSGSYSGSEGHRELSYPVFASINNGIAKDNDRDNLYYYSGKLSYSDFTFTGGYQWRKKGVPTGAFGTVFNDQRFTTVDERWYMDLAYQHEFFSQVNVKARLYYDYYYYHGFYPYDYSGIGLTPFTLNKDVVQAQWAGGELTLTRRFFDRHRITVGTEYRSNFIVNQSNRDIDPPATYLDDKRRSSFIAGYVQDEWSITDHLALHAGFRHDQYSTFGGTTNPRAGLIYTWKTTAVKLLYGQAFRAPTAYEQFYAPGTSVKTNPNLKPEKLHTYELVLEQYLGRHVRALGSLYQYNISDLIVWTADSAGTSFFDNVDDISARGVELTMEGKWPTGLEGRVSYALQTSHMERTKQRLTNSPQHLVKTNLIVPLIPDKLFAGFEGRYTSSRLTLAGNNASPFYILNLSLFSQHLIKGWELSAHINNVMNQKYGYPGDESHRQDIIDQDGRTFWVKLKYRF